MKSEKEITSQFNRHIARVMNLFEVCGNPNENLKQAVKANIWDLHDDIIEGKEYKGGKENGSQQDDKA